jgi:hypothetical protein
MPETSIPLSTVARLLLRDLRDRRDAIDRSIQAVEAVAEMYRIDETPAEIAAASEESHRAEGSKTREQPSTGRRKFCAICGKDFAPSNNRQKFCGSPRCTKIRQQKALEKFMKKREDTSPQESAPKEPAAPRVVVKTLSSDAPDNQPSTPEAALFQYARRNGGLVDIGKLSEELAASRKYRGTAAAIRNRLLDFAEECPEFRQDGVGTVYRLTEEGK